MRAIWTIFQREVSQYFSSPLAYIMAFGFLLLTGLLFNNDLTRSVTVRPVNPAAIPRFLSLMLVFFSPLLTMRLLAEESREGTLELLLTAPVPDYAIVIGKFLSAWAYYTFLLGLTFIYQIILLFIIVTTQDMAHAFSAYMGIWLYGGATIAVGIVFSALTDNQILAAFLGTASLLLLYMGDLAGQIVTNIDLAIILRNLTLQGHFSTSFAVGLIRLENIVYFAGMIVIMLYITIQLVESRRWR